MNRIKKLKNFIILNNMLSIAIPLILVGLIIIPLIFIYTEKNISEKNTMIATIISQRLTDFLDESFLPLDELNGLLDSGVLNDAGIITYLNTVLKGSDAIEGFEILDAQGIVKVIAPENINILGANRSGQGFFSVTRETGQPYISSIFISQQTGKPTITIAIPHGEGVLVAYLNLEKISMLSLDLNKAFGDQVRVSITDSNGVFISHKDINKVYQRDYEENFETIHPDDTNDRIVAANYNGSNMIISHSHLPGTGWYVFVYESYDSIINTITPVLGVILLFIILLVLFSRFISHRVFKDIDYSLQELNSQTHEIAAGDYHPILAGSRFIEFDMLTDNFNGMVESVKERDETLKNLAYYDPQTRLPNAAYLTEHLNQFILENREKIVVICYDIKNFKRINDTYGPSFGDQVLEVMGARLLDLNLTQGFVARIVDSNFIRVLTDTDDRKDILSEISGMTAILNQAMTINENHVYLDFHVGIALYPDDAQTVEELLQYAHTAADMAKDNGLFKHAFFENAMKQTLLRNMTLENSLRSALKNHEFYLHYQSQIDVKTRETRGFEALIRWEHPQLGKISPLDFIHIAESTGLIIPIGAWVLETACRQMVELNKKMGSNMMMSVNISPVQITSEKFPGMVEETLKRSGLSPDLLELEITENLFIHSVEDAVKILNRLKAIGIKISLDDFGTGYSSLSYLKNLPIDTLKIDQTFTRDLLVRKSHEQLMESMIVMAHTLNMNAIVEGVEELAQFDCLKAFGCDHVQGYYFSRPIDALQVEAYLKTRKPNGFETGDY